MRSGRAAVFAALFLFSLVCVASAQDVTLTSKDGDVEISGTLLGFDGEYYRVDTIYGELTVDGSGVACDGPGCPNLQDFIAQISISGSARMGAVLLPTLVEEFARSRDFDLTRQQVDNTHFQYDLFSTRTGDKSAIFQFRVTTSDEGFADLLANEADIAMATREIRNDERTRALDAGLGDLKAPARSVVLALDAIVPVVSQQNPIQSIAPSDLARVFAGEISNWAAFGGPDAPIALHAPMLKAGMGQAAQELVLDPVGLVMAPNVVRHDTDSDLVAAVSRDPFAIGLSSYREATKAKALSLEGACGRALRATRGTVKTEDYPMTAPMFLYLPSRRLPKIGREFMRFVRSQEAQVLIRRSGFIDQALEETSINRQGDRLVNAIASAGPDVPLDEVQRLVATLSPMARLTLSFRFEAGETDLDAQSRSNVVRLSRALEQGEFDGRAVLFVGFSDGEGPAEPNRRIALSRAQAVRDAVLELSETADFSRIDLGVDAYGEAMPLACDDSVWGRKANRRVEVWVR